MFLTQAQTYVAHIDAETQFKLTNFRQLTNGEDPHLICGFVRFSVLRCLVLRIHLGCSEYRLLTNFIFFKMASGAVLNGLANNPGKFIESISSLRF